jgi:hypothetical protein
MGTNHIGKVGGRDAHPHGPRPQLRVLRGEELLRDAPPLRVPSLTAQPGRPGEMPESVFVELARNAVQRAVRSAAVAEIPLALWLRAAVEASRQLGRVAAALGCPRDIVAADLREAAAALPQNLNVLRCRRQLDYAAQIRAGNRTAGSDAAGRVEILAPDQLLAAWSLDAAEAGEGLADFVTRHVLQAPAEPELWEAAAAEAMMSLGEWVYSRALAATRR